MLKKPLCIYGSSIKELQAGDYTGDIQLYPEISITGTTTCSIGRMHVCSGTTADYSITLPVITGNEGKLLGIRMDSNLTKLVTVSGQTSELIDGTQTRVMWSNEVALLLCTSTGWVKVGGKTIPFMASMATSGVTQLFAAGSWVKLNCNTFVFGTASMNDVSANKQLILKRAGVYSCTAKIAYGSQNGSTTRNFIGVFKNGTVLPDGSAAIYAPASIASAPILTRDIVFQLSDVGLGLDLRGYFEIGSYSTTVISASVNYDTYLTLTEKPIW